MKFFLTALLFLIVKSISAQAPDWVWAKSAGGISNDYSNATCTDANGNVYITGTFQGSSITFGSYTLHNAATGSLDIFVVKYDASGNVLWAKSGDGTQDDLAYGICTDADGNVSITGYFISPSLSFGTIIINNLNSTGGSASVFVAKYDSDGNILWAKSAGKKGTYAQSFGICSDSDGSLYITGTFGYGGNIFFGNDSLKNIGGYDVFIAKYDLTGNIVWVKGFGGQGSEAGQSICIDANRNLYITGYFQYKIGLGSDTIITSNNTAIFVAKYNTNGNYVWIKSANGAPGSDYNYSNGITAYAGGVYITGSYESSIILGDTLGNAGYNSIFVAKYDTNGNAIWGKSPGGTNYDYGTGICTDGSGNILVTGYFASSFLNFGGIPVINANVGYDDIFVAEYDTSGKALLAGSIGGQDNDYGMGICAGTGSTGDDVYVTGYFGSYSLNFGNTTITNNGSYDIFLAKLNLLTGMEEYSSSTWNVFPNPSNGQFTVYSPSFKAGSTIAIYNVMGEKVYSQIIGNNSNNQIPINLKVNAGLYFIQLTDSQQSFTKKIIIE